MVAASASTDLTTFWLESATTVIALGGGASGLGNPEVDFYVQGSNCISKAAWTNAVKGFIIDALGTTFTVPTDGCVIAFAKYDAAGSLDTKAGGGLRFLIGSGSAAYREYFFAGSDTLIYDSWVPVTVDPNTATADVSAGTTSWRWVGILGDLPTTAGPTKGNPIALDAIRYGRGRVDYINGQAGAYGTFDVAELAGNVNGTRWGLIEKIRGAYLIQGFHQLGTSGTAVDFRDSNKVIFWRASAANNLTGDSVSTAFNRLEVVNASSNVQMDNIVFQALGTAARGRFVHTAGALSLTNCQFVDMDTFSFLAGATVTNCTFRRTNAITAPGTDMRGSKVLTPTIAASANALVWNVNTDPDGKLDDMEFSKGTAAHHAIEFGTSSPLTMTLRGIAFSGFHASNGQADSTLRIGRTTGTVTINLVGCSGNISYATAGATVVLVTDPRTLTIEVRDSAGNLITDNTEITLVRTSDTTILHEEDNVTDGITAYAYTYGGSDVSCYLNVLSVVNYVPKTVEPVTLIDADQTVVVQLEDERGRYANP